MEKEVSIDFSRLELTAANLATVMEDFSKKYKTEDIVKLKFVLNNNLIVDTGKAFDALSQYPLTDLELSLAGSTSYTDSTSLTIVLIL